MESEAKPLIDNMTVESEKSVHERRVVFGKLYEKDVAVVVCGVGKVNAAAGTQYAIDCLCADRIVNVGVAGGLNLSTSVGDIYEISQAVQYDFDLVKLNGTPMGTLNEYDKPYLELAVTGDFPLRRLASGDRFNDDTQDFELLTKELNADIRDMEGGAMAHVCRHAGIPFFSFKAISDVAGAGSTTEQFLKNLAVCTENLGKNIKKIIGAVNG